MEPEKGMGEERAGRWKEGCGRKDWTGWEGAGRAVVFLLRLPIRFH